MYIITGTPKSLPLRDEELRVQVYLWHGLCYQNSLQGMNEAPNVMKFRYQLRDHDGPARRRE